MAAVLPRSAARASSARSAVSHHGANFFVARPALRRTGPAKARSPLLAQQPSVLLRCASPSATSVQEAVTAGAVAPGAVHPVSASELPGVLESAGASTLVVVDVYTAWCGPCKMIAPEVEKLAADDFKDNVVFTKMDCTSVNENKKWAMAQNVKALPTFILFKGGQRVGDMTGAKVAALRKLIETHL